MALPHFSSAVVIGCILRGRRMKLCPDGFADTVGLSVLSPYVTPRDHVACAGRHCFGAFHVAFQVSKFAATAFGASIPEVFEPHRLDTALARPRAQSTSGRFGSRHDRRRSKSPKRSGAGAAHACMAGQMAGRNGRRPDLMRASNRTIGRVRRAECAGGRVFGSCDCASQPVSLCRVRSGRLARGCAAEWQWPIRQPRGSLDHQSQSSEQFGERSRTRASVWRRPKRLPKGSNRPGCVRT